MGIAGVPVLIVDDDAVVRKVLAAQLQRLGLQSKAVGSGPEALPLPDGVSFIFLDCNMLEWDGYRTARELRLTGYRGKIVGLTGDEGDHIRDRCLDAGMSDYRRKPLSMEALESLLSPHFELRAIPAGLDSLSGAVPDPLKRVRGLAQASGNPALFTRLVGSFLRSSDEAFQRLHAARDTGDVPEIKATLHRLKGGSGTFGAADLSALVAEAERQLHESGLKEADTALNVIEAAWCKLRTRLQRALQEPV